MGVGSRRQPLDPGGPPWGYAYETHLGGTLQWDVGSGEVTLGHTEGRPGADTYTGSHPDRSEVPALEEESWRRQLRTFTSPEGEVTQRDYTAQGQLASVTLPWGVSTSMVYGADGEVDTQTLASGETVTFTHDAAGRLLTRTAGAQDFATFAYGAGDRVTSSTDATGTTSYTHDTAGRRTGLTYPSGGRVQYEHDAEDRVTAVVAEPVAGGPEAHRTEYTYDAAGNVATVTDPTGGVTEYEYDDAGRRTERRYPNGITTTWTYDVRDRITSVTHTRVADSTVLLSRAYVRAATGEPTRITHEDGTYVALTYDAALRIASETYHSADDSMLSEVSYTYDQDGNRTSRTVDGETETYTYTSGSRLTEVSVGGVPSQTFAYDTGGRVTELRRAGQNLDLAWDSSDHVVGVTNVDTTGEVQWHFDASGRRTGRDEGSSARRYLVAPNVGQSLESPQLVMDGLGNTQVGYVFEGEHPIARYGASGVPEYYLEDGIRSVVGVVDDAGSVVETYAYDSFGVTRGGGAEPDGFGFQGMWRDADGTYFVRARVYDAVTGRFLSRDPADGRRYDPTTYVPYQFGNGNPLVFFDPTGRMTLSQLGNVVTVIAIVAATAVTVAQGRFLNNREAEATSEAERRGWIVIRRGPGVRYPPHDRGPNDPNPECAAGEWLGTEDALRHCYAACVVTLEYGAFLVDVQNATESDDADGRMDTSNNNRGRELARVVEHRADCLTMCADAAENGDLLCLDGPNG